MVNFDQGVYRDTLPTNSQLWQLRSRPIGSVLLLLLLLLLLLISFLHLPLLLHLLVVVVLLLKSSRAPTSHH